MINHPFKRISKDGATVIWFSFSANLVLIYLKHSQSKQACTANGSC